METFLIGLVGLIVILVILYLIGYIVYKITNTPKSSSNKIDMIQNITMGFVVLLIVWLIYFLSTGLGVILLEHVKLFQ